MIGRVLDSFEMLNECTNYYVNRRTNKGVSENLISNGRNQLLMDTEANSRSPIHGITIKQIVLSGMKLYVRGCNLECL